MLERELSSYKTSQANCYTKYLEAFANFAPLQTSMRLFQFNNFETDFERIRYILKLIAKSKRESGNGYDRFNNLPKKEDIVICFGKSDRISEVHRLYVHQMLRNQNIERALYHATSAVFYAASPLQKALAFARRCNILYNLNMLHEAIADGELSIKVRLYKIIQMFF